MNRKEIISLIILLAVIGYGAVNYYTRSFTEVKSKYLMDTNVEISATSKNKHIGNQIDSVFTYIINLEAKLNEYKLDSWVSRVNESEAWYHPMDPDVYEILCIADSLYKMSGGSFDITVKPVWDLWGFNEEEPTPPDSLLIKEKLALVDFQKLKFDRKRLIKPAGMQITLGAIAKGYILDKARVYMAKMGIKSGYINCRSSMTFFGDPLPHLVYVQHPRRTDDSIASFRIKNQSVGTSGDYQQFYEVNGIRYHHIIDPRSGYPVQNVHAVTVLHTSAAWADGLSTALFLMPPETAIEKIKAVPESNAIIYYSKDGEIMSLKTAGMQELDLNEKEL